MKQILWKQLIGQLRVRTMLGNAFTQGTLGHAYLFCGDEGVGTFAAALDLAGALLCQSQGDLPCTTCESCRKVENLAHPGLSLLCPFTFAKEHRDSKGTLTEEGWKFIVKSLGDKVKNPYRAVVAEGMRTLPIDWIREVTHSVQRGTVDGERQVLILSDVDLLSKESANAMLKTLEEPPAGTVMILCTARPHAVLQTIRSRCQIVRFGPLSEEQISKALMLANAGHSPQAIALAAESAQGSLSTAFTALESGADELGAEVKWFFDAAVSADILAVAPRLEALADSGPGKLERFCILCLSCVRNSWFASQEGAAKYFHSQSGLLFSPGFELDLTAAGKLVDACEETLSAIRAHGNPLMTLTAFHLALAEIFTNVKKQQAG